MKQRQITFYFSGDPHTICDYMLRLAREFAKKDAVFGFLLYGKPYSFWRDIFNKKERIWEKKDGIYMIRQIYVLPFQRVTAIRILNAYIHSLICYPLVVSWIKFRHGIQTTGKPIFIFYHPEKEVKYFRFIFRLFSLTHTTLFDVVDYPPVHRVNNSLAIYREYIRKADVVTVISKALYSVFRRIRKDIRIVPPGFALEDFRHPKSRVVFPKDKLIIGYSGAIGSRLDYPLLYELIKRNPQWRFVFWGPIQIVEGENEEEIKKNIESLLHYNNVVHGFSKKKSEVAWVVNHFDICIIPYDIRQDQNKYCLPM
ncbi:MAG: hypothetical protein AAB966_05695, partial [Patescibacteria group bacterium]